MDTPVPAAPRLASIHYLRGLAALMVVVYHSFSQALVPIDDPRYVLWLKHGVAIFFVISGFVMVVSTADGRQSPWRFLARRVGRVAPLYWLATLCWALVYAYTDAGHLVSSLLFAPSVDPVGGATRPPLLDVGWTLQFEMFFYAAFALCLFVPGRQAMWLLAFALLIGSQLPAAVALPAPFDFYLSAVLAEFAGGMLLALSRMRAPIWCLPLGFAWLAIVPDLVDSRLVAITVPALLIVASARSLDPHLRRWRVPWLIGDASYAIYLAHMFVLLYVQRLFEPLPPPVVSFALCVFGSLGVGVLVHRTIELPMLASRRPRGRPTMKGAAAAG